MRALVDALVTADAKGVEGALLGVEGLPPLSDCAAVAALRAPLPPPADPTARARIVDVRAEIARAYALQDTARMSDANDVAERSVRTAREVGYAPLEAEALEAQGRLLDASQEPRRAVEVLQDAVLAAMAGRHESVEALAWIELVHAASLAASFPVARDAARHAHAALARDPDDGRLGLLLCNEGFEAWREGKLGEARTALERALAIREKLLPTDHPDLATTLMYLANVMNDQGQYDDALTASRRALAIRERAFGPAHPSVASPLMTVGAALLFKGDAAEAEAVYQRMADLKMAAFGPENEGAIAAIEAVGNAQIHEGKLDAALENESRALALRERYVGPESMEVARSLVNLADVYLAMKRWSDVMPLAQRATGILESSGGAQSWFIAYPLVQLGRARMGMGNAEAGRAPLERALTLVSSPDADPHLTSEVRAAMALVLKASHGEAVRAGTLAAQARATLLREPSANVDLLRELASAFPP